MTNDGKKITTQRLFVGGKEMVPSDLANPTVAGCAVVTYDFAVDGGTAGAIVPVGSPTIPNNAVVWVEAIDVLTTCTSAASTATIKLGLPTDGDLTTAIAINDGSAPWTKASFSRIAGALATPLTKKTTAARVPTVTVGVQNVTAGKVVFYLRYWVNA